MTTHEGLALGHQRAEDAAANAGPTWVEQAVEAFRAHARHHRHFTTEQVRLAHPEVPEPPEKRAWGAVPRILCKEGVIRKNGWVRADSRSVHGMVVTLWESTVVADA